MVLKKIEVQQNFQQHEGCDRQGLSSTQSVILEYTTQTFGYRLSLIPRV